MVEPKTVEEESKFKEDLDNLNDVPIDDIDPAVIIGVCYSNEDCI